MACPSTAYLAWPLQYPPETQKGLFLYLLNMADFKMYKILRDEFRPPSLHNSMEALRDV